MNPPQKKMPARAALSHSERSRGRQVPAEMWRRAEVRAKAATPRPRSRWRWGGRGAPCAKARAPIMKAAIWTDRRAMLARPADSPIPSVGGSEAEARRATPMASAAASHDNAHGLRWGRGWVAWHDAATIATMRAPSASAIEAASRTSIVCGTGATLAEAGTL
jgi:hypothetical protein